ncbi:YceH family protein [Terriglobus sp.]|uniref:YceH family protein n=1 Tax=Terriglobus sp. TaxID=1889013 RepID=UPI003AFF70BB
MLQLSLIEARVLGALMEKEVTTPETYPLSLNALVAACNQKSSREPVMQLTEREVETALRSLDAMELVRADHGSRVERYENRARTVFHLRRDETAVLCLLLLRGPQTPGELRGRADRLFQFDDIAQVTAALQRMSTMGDENSQRVEPLVRVLPRQPGSREARYLHLLTDANAYNSAAATDVAVENDAGGGHESRADADRMQALETAVAALERRVRHLEEQLGIGAQLA